MVGGTEDMICSSCKTRCSLAEVTKDTCPACGAKNTVFPDRTPVEKRVPTATPGGTLRPPAPTPVRVSQASGVVAAVGPAEPTLRVTPCGSRFQIASESPGQYTVLTVSRATFRAFVDEAERLLRMA